MRIKLLPHEAILIVSEGMAAERKLLKVLSNGAIVLESVDDKIEI